MLSYIDMLLEPAARLDRNTARDTTITEDVRTTLETGRTELRGLLYEGKGGYRKILLSWYATLSRECTETLSDGLVDTNTKRMAIVQSHLILMMRNASLDSERVRELVASTVFIASRKQWNTGGDDSIPQTVVFEAIHALRRRIIAWIRGNATQAELDAIGDGAMRVSSTSGAMVPGPDDVCSRWAFVNGEDHIGCVAVTDGAAVSGAIGAISAPICIESNRRIETLLDVQLF